MSPSPAPSPANLASASSAVAEALALSAISAGSAATLALALKKGASPNATFPNGNSLTRQALVNIANSDISSIRYGQSLSQFNRDRLTIIDLLVGAGADLTALGPDAQPDLHYAARHLEPITLGRLLKGAPDLSSQSSAGLSAFHCAVISNKRDNARALLDAGADINAQDFEGDTPLHFAAARGLRDMVEFLAQRGASCLILNCDGANASEMWHRFHGPGSSILALLEAQVLSQTIAAAPAQRAGLSRSL